MCASLKTYDGTLVFVSHNRSLVRQLATTIWNVENQAVEQYPGSLDEYLYSMAERRMAVAATDTKTAAKALAKATSKAAVIVSEAASARDREDEKARKRREADARSRRAKVLGPLEKQVVSLEERVQELESAQKQRGADLADPEVYADDARRKRLLSEYQTAQEKLEDLNGRWEKAMADLEVAQASFAAEDVP